MNNLLSYCGLVDARIRASEKDLPVQVKEYTQKTFGLGSLGNLLKGKWLVPT